MRRVALLRALFIGAGVVVSASAAPTVLLEERFGTAHGAWIEDDYSRIRDGVYVIDARGTGGYYRWLQEPDATTRFSDFETEVTVRKLRGNNEQPLFGLLFRVQASWRDSYFLVINGAGEYFCGKFAAGQAVILKQGRSEVLGRAGATNRLAVAASGARLTLKANGEVLGEVEDRSYAEGRIGLCVEAPAQVSFDDLLVTAPTGPAVEPGTLLFADDFATNRGWSLDEVRTIADGAYQLRSSGEAVSYLGWNPRTRDLGDFRASVEVRRLAGGPNMGYGLLWHVQDRDHFEFFIIRPDGRYYAGIAAGGAMEVRVKGTSLAVREGQQVNTLTVSALGERRLGAINGRTEADYLEPVAATGALGFYLEDPEAKAQTAAPAQVAFDNLQATRLTDGTDATTERVVLDDPLVTATTGWPEDADHVFQPDGYYLRAPGEGSRTTIRLSSLGLGDGIYEVSARPVQGNLAGSYGLVVRASARSDQFYYLLLNSTGQWVFGECRNNTFANHETGTVAQLRGGKEGNRLRFELREGSLTWAINGQTLGTATVPAEGHGAVGLHVEQGVIACFRNLMVRTVDNRT